MLYCRIISRLSNAEYRGGYRERTWSSKRFASRINYVANEPRVKLRHGVIAGRMRDVFATFNEHV